MNRKPTKAYRAFQVFNTAVMLFVIFITLYPFVYLVAQSFSSDAAASTGKVTFYPIGFNINTYRYILRDGQFFRYYLNTIVYSALGTAISVMATALIAYPLSKPIIATMCLFYLVSLWNEWFGPMLYLDTKDKWPIALYVRQLVKEPTIQKSAPR